MWVELEGVCARQEGWVVGGIHSRKLKDERKTGERCLETWNPSISQAVGYGHVPLVSKYISRGRKESRHKVSNHHPSPTPPKTTTTTTLIGFFEDSCFKEQHISQDYSTLSYHRRQVLRSADHAPQRLTRPRTELSAGLISDDHNHSTKRHEPTIARIRKHGQSRTPFISAYTLNTKCG